MTRAVARGTGRSGRALPLLARLGLGIVLIGGLLVSLSNPISVVAYVPSAAVGALLIVRRPANPIGWLLLLFALGASFVARGRYVDLTPAEVEASGVSMSTQLYLLAQSVFSTSGLLVPIALIAVVFPDGAWPRSRSRRVSAIGITLLGAATALQVVAPTFSALTPDGTTVLIPNPIGIARDGPASPVLDPFILAMAGLALCVAGFVIRFRSAAEIERQQDKWLLAGLGFLVVSIVWGSALVSIAGPDPRWATDRFLYALSVAIAWGPATIALTMPPVAIAIAVMRYRLYEIDRIVSRTISYAAVTASLVAIYVGLVLILQGPLSTITGGETIAVAVSTLVAAALFQPLRVWIQDIVDRRFNRARYDGERTAAAFAVVLRDDIDPSVVQAELVSTVLTALRPHHLGVWLRPTSR